MPQIGRDAIPFVMDPAFVPAANADGSVNVTELLTAPAGTLKAAVHVVGAAGSPFTQTITIGGAYLVGDEVRITITSSDTSRQMWRKSYSYIVQPGDTNNDIAAAISSAIDTDGLASETPYTASVLGAVVTVVAKDALSRGFTMYDFTDSAAGTVALGVAAYTREVGTPDFLRAAGVPESQIVAALYDVVRIDYEANAAVPFIDTKGAKEIELVIFCTNAQAVALVAECPN